MVHARMLFGVIALVATAISGCATMANLDGRDYMLLGPAHQERPTPFGGVGRDVRWTLRAWQRVESPGDCFFAGISSVICTVDLPFSLVGDIVTLPKVLTVMHTAPLRPLEQWQPPATEARPPETPGSKTAPTQQTSSNTFP